MYREREAGRQEGRQVSRGKDGHLLISCEKVSCITMQLLLVLVALLALIAA